MAITIELLTPVCEDATDRDSDDRSKYSDSPPLYDKEDLRKKKTQKNRWDSNTRNRQP